MFQQLFEATFVINSIKDHNYEPGIKKTKVQNVVYSKKEKTKKNALKHFF